MKKHLQIRVSGRVQGTLYRVTAQKKALELGITGFARNEADGSVYLEAEGEEEPLKKFVAWCRQGPPAAQVEKVEATESSLKNYPGFQVL